MTIALLIIIGLCLGSFVNALVWRLYEQSKTKNKKKLQELSIVHGRSICPDCKHQLAFWDLVPVVSWLSLRGKCRYCHKPIKDNPLVEIILPLVLVGSYVAWPYTLQDWSNLEMLIFGIWTLILTGFAALAVYDIRWYLLPNKIVFPVSGLSAVMVGLIALTYKDSSVIWEAILGMGIVFGLFYFLYQFSKGKWIGGGDVKLGVALGLLAGGIVEALLLLFISSVLGTLYGAFLATVGRQKLSRKLRIPFGPFLLIAATLVVLFGSDIIHWYTDLVLSI